MAVGRFFFSAAPTAQNSPEFHFCFINYFIQLSLLRSLIGTLKAVHTLFKIHTGFSKNLPIQELFGIYGG